MFAATLNESGRNGLNRRRACDGRLAPEAGGQKSKLRNHEETELHMATNSDSATPEGGEATSKPATTRARTRAKTASARTTKATSAKRGSSTTKRSGTQAASKAKGTRKTTSTSTMGTVSTYAERAVLIPVGAVLIARERLVDGVSDVISTYSTSTKAEAQLKRFEKRGSTVRDRIERDARKTRVRVERELRRRRRELDRTVSGIDRRMNRTVKGIDRKRTALASNIESTSSQIEGRVQARIKDGASLAEKVQDKILDLI